MKKVNNKKGFTLAELLVVVAIMAILIAIAVPIFTGMLTDAQTTAENANIRSVRAAAVTHILTKEPAAGETWTKAGPTWNATATVSGTGDISGLAITNGGAAADEDVVKNADGTFTVTAHISSLD